MRDATSAELGVRVAKTYWGENLASCPRLPGSVVIAGVPKCETERKVFEFVYDGMQRRAIGMNLGRNVWQNDHPVTMARALRAVIHDNANPAQATDLYHSLLVELAENLRAGSFAHPKWALRHF